MKINGITATDYRTGDGSLELMGLAAAHLEEVTGLDTRVVEVRTDAGDLVEALAGYAVRSVTYDLTTGTYAAVLTLAVEDPTAATLTKLAGELETSRGEVWELQTAVDELVVASLEGGADHV